MKMNNVDFETYFRHYPDSDGYFGRYGGVSVEETLTKAKETQVPRKELLALLDRIYPEKEDIDL